METLLLWGGAVAAIILAVMALLKAHRQKVLNEIEEESKRIAEEQVNQAQQIDQNITDLSDSDVDERLRKYRADS